METIIKNFSKPDSHLDLEKVSINSCQLCPCRLAKMTVQPTWKWLTSLKPNVKTEWCMATHVICLTNGRLHVIMKNGQEYDIRAGDCYEIQSEHNAWVVGEQETIALEFQQETINSIEQTDLKKKEH